MSERHGTEPPSPAALGQFLSRGIRWDVHIDTRPCMSRCWPPAPRTRTPIALDFLGGKTSFGELAKKITAFAGALQSQFGVTKGSRVALMLPNTPFYRSPIMPCCAPAAPWSIATRSIRCAN